MKKTISLIAILCMCSMSISFADSLFPSLSSNEELIHDLAPSYESVSDVHPATILPYGEGGQAVTYIEVNDQGYYALGEHLQKLGYEVTASNSDGRNVELKVSDGQYNIGIIYSANDQKMTLIYEKDVEFERYAHCNQCRGSGVCKRCGGNAYKTGTACSECGGTGICPGCNGAGKLQIVKWNGNDCVICEKCHNTGNCRSCNGSGRTKSIFGGYQSCFVCKGSGKCGYCHGTGWREITYDLR